MAQQRTVLEKEDMDLTHRLLISGNDTRFFIYAITLHCQR